MSKETEFSPDDADQWFNRNFANTKNYQNLIDEDPVIRWLSHRGNILTNTHFLEVGCSNAWRLNAIREIFSAKVFGADPSPLAIRSGSKLFPEVALSVASSDQLPYANHSFDMVLMGFCLYLVERDRLFRSVAEVDRVLKPGGHLLLYDFLPQTPNRVPYKHRNGLFSYKMDYSALFKANPSYRETKRIVFSHDDFNNFNPTGHSAVGVVELQKLTSVEAYPEFIS